MLSLQRFLPAPVTALLVVTAALALTYTTEEPVHATAAPTSRVVASLTVVPGHVVHPARSSARGAEHPHETANGGAVNQRPGHRVVSVTPTRTSPRQVALPHRATPAGGAVATVVVAPLTGLLLNGTTHGQGGNLPPCAPTCPATGHGGAGGVVINDTVVDTSVETGTEASEPVVVAVVDTTDPVISPDPEEDGSAGDPPPPGDDPECWGPGCPDFDASFVVP